MQINNILRPELVIYNADLGSKQQILQQISILLCSCNTFLNKADVFNNLLKREYLCSTGLGHGIAIPHCRSENIKEPVACLLSLKNTVQFNDETAYDKQLVKLVFGLVVPEENHKKHLELLAELAGLLDNEKIRTSLHNAKNATELFELLSSSDNTAIDS